MSKTILNKNDFNRLKKEGNLPLLDILSEKQIQPNGLELTLNSICKFTSSGKMGEIRELPELEELKFNDDGWLKLEKGSYKIKLNETVKIPNDYFALARPRSSLLRMGATISTALWDSGYIGKSESLLTVYNEYGIEIEKNSRMMQLIFFDLGEIVEESYNGKYQFENIKK
jgi:dUTP pyrophosphatase